MMRNRLPPPRRPVTIGHQIVQMQRVFPAFQYCRQDQIPTWYGPLQPARDSPTYTVKVAYRFAGRHSKPPRVWVKSPKARADAPHRYNDGSLCLYFPPDRDWTPYKYISETIVPWTALWLAFYEIWLDTGHWHGPEVVHTGVKQGKQ
jgi:hypothetical protein